MELGVFIPIGNNGWIISKTSPQYMPSFELNKSITQKAESYDMDFVLSMVKLRGFGGETEFWDHNLESFTLMSGLAAVTSKIRLWASTAVLALHPAMVARMGVTIDDISGGRFGINIVSGWNKSEYEQMGVWPGDEHFEHRYKLSREYMDVMNGLWDHGNFSYDGDYYKLDDCLGKPQPKNKIEIVCAGQSDEGMAFCAEYGDYQFVIGGTDLQALSDTAGRLDIAKAKTGRDVKCIALYQIFIEDTDEKAEEYVQYCKDGVDTEAVGFMMGMAAADVNAAAGGTADKVLLDMTNNVMFNIGVIAGSPATVAAKIDEVAELGVGGMMITFPDFEKGIDRFGKEVMPLLKSN